MDAKEKQFFVKLTQDRTENANVLEKPSLSGVQRSVVEKYSDQAHFIYELLQNADDVKATEARFYLYHDRLVFIHNGSRHFNITDPDNEAEDKKNGTLGDLNSITSVANSAKNGNEATIGKFGVGFKAVFQYTETPHIYDPNVAFKIERFIVPQQLDGDYPERERNETVFVFPFDHKERNKEEAFEDISDKLRHLVYPSLFLNHLKDISFEIENTKTIGVYEKTCVKEKQFGDITARKLKLQYNERNDIIADTLWLFSRKDEHGAEYCVGFFVDTEGKLKAVNRTAFCFFPTKEDTKLHFIIHAPFLLTDSREGIKAGDTHNKTMITLLAKLSSDALSCLRSIGEEEGVRLIDDDILDIVPTDENDFSALDDKAKISFLPFFKELKNALKNGLLPTKDGYTSYFHARWSDTKDISTLLSDEQLSQLFSADQIHWVFCSRPRHALDAYGKTVIKNYIDNLVYDWYEEKRIFKAIKPFFIQTQSFEWLHKFYNWIADSPKRFYVHLQSSPIFLNDKKEPVAAYDKDGQKTLFLPSASVKNCPTIHPSFLENETTKQFLLNVVELEEPSLQDYIYNTVIPDYKQRGFDPFESFKLFFQYYKQCRATEIDNYINSIKELDFLEYYDSSAHLFKRSKASDLYYPDKELVVFFAPKTDAHFLALKKYSETVPNDAYLSMFLDKLGILHLPKVFEYTLTAEERKATPDLPTNRSSGKREYVETRIDGCEELADYIEENQVAEKSFLLWRIIVSVFEKCSKQNSKISSNGDYKYFYYTPHVEYYPSLFAKHLQNATWLFDKDGNFVSPREITVTELSNDYDTKSQAAQLLIEFLDLKEEGDNALTQDKKLLQLCKKYGVENEEDFREFSQWKKAKENGEGKKPDDETKSKTINTIEAVVKDIERRAKEKPKDKEPEPVDIDCDDYIPGAIDYKAKIEKEKEKQAAEIQEITRMQDLQELALTAQPYSYLWFKTLLEMEILNSDIDSINNREVNISFAQIEKEEGTQKTYLLKHPSKYIPQYMEDLADIPLVIHMKDGSAKTVPIEVSSVQSYSLHVKLKDASVLYGVDLSNVQEASIKATRPVFLLQELKKKIVALKAQDGTDLPDEYNMKDNLPGNLEFVFGPPGTGKTTYLANQVIIPLMKQSENVKVLVLTPTNKAADVITTRIMETMGKDISYTNWLTRFGITGDERIENSAVFRDKTFDLRKLQRSVTITTIARFAYDFFMPSNERLYLDALKWDYIVIDEASMIPLVQIIYPIYRKTPKKFIIAGDPFQIEPIATVDLWADQNIYKLVNLNSFVNPLTEPKQYPVVQLTTQYRSIPEIGEVFSKFTYDGILKHNRDSASRKDLHLEGVLDVDSLNILKFPVSKYESIYRCKRLNGTTPYQTYSAIFTMEFATYLAKALEANNKGERFSIGIVAPYKAQASLIDRLISSIEIPHDVSVQVGTIHGFQGDECDIVLVVLNTPPSITSSSRLFLNKQNVLNVAISRARDYLFVIMPDNQTEDIFRLQKVKRIEDLMRHSGHFTEKTTAYLEKIIFNDEKYIENNSFATGHQAVNVYGNPEKRYEIRSEDAAVDVQIHKSEVRNVSSAIDVPTHIGKERPVYRSYNEIEVGDAVWCWKYKEGIVTFVDKSTHSIRVKFAEDEKTFNYPDTFEKGFLQMR